ncbi:unnamed protein product [Symbiodinium sp. CCMP2592]|nr:unnamed protein product [Symbiodinium sp. CCMP2592]CAE7377189.1 unnamed protein product [Symbiodinium sp. CCMP2592]CAE7702813.1 unnamed protein product [Symbiodinium sp. CCMP2592]
MLQHLPDNVLVHLLGFLHCSNCPYLKVREQYVNFVVACRVALRMSEYGCAGHVCFHSAREVIRMRCLCKYWKGELEGHIRDIKNHLLAIHETFIDECQGAVTLRQMDEFTREEDLNEETSVEDCKYAVQRSSEDSFKRCANAFRALRDRGNRRFLSLYQERLFFVALASHEEVQDNFRFQHVLESESQELDGRVIDV